jgi:Chaperone of endosialidase
MTNKFRKGQEMMHFPRTLLLVSQLCVLLGAGQALAQSNTALGDSALQHDTTGFDNTAVGAVSLKNNTTGSANTATGAGALYSNIDGHHNTATGDSALHSNTSGTYNAAIGVFALQSNTIGYDNAAMGASALERNTKGYYNTAAGAGALLLNTEGYYNTAAGVFALENNTTGTTNTAVGTFALQNNVDSSGNTAVGYGALMNNLTGDNTGIGANALGSTTYGLANTAMGIGALERNTTGSGNIAIGYLAGSNLTTGSGNINIGNDGVTGEADTIRIGDSDQTRTFIAAISGVTTGGRAVGVVVDSNGQLGTISSSRRFKDEILDMGEASRGLSRLRPVTFRYKQALTDGSRPLHYGLIAEEVAEIYPELVVYDPKTGEPQTVLYHELPAMLLNELQKQAAELTELRARLASLQAALHASPSTGLANARQRVARE